MKNPPTVHTADRAPTDSPEAECRALADYGRRLAGALRPATVADHLAAALRDWFSPSAAAIALLDGDSGRLRLLHAAPPDAAWLPALAEAALARGPFLDAGTPTPAGPEGAPPCWMGAPLAARLRPAGVVVVGGPPARYSSTDLARLEALAALTTLALDGATLVDQADRSGISWAETLDAVGLPICIVERGGRLRRANRAFTALVHAPAGAGLPWLALVPPAWGEGIQASIDAAGSGREFDLEAGDRTLAVAAFPLPPDGVVLLFSDRTERRRLQAQLIQSEKMSAVGQLVAGVAHDLNNPLASVLGFADFLAESGEVPPSLREPVRVIQQESLRAATIVRNLLSFARKHEHRRSSVAVRPLLEATLAILRNQLIADHMQARLEVEPDLPDIHADPNQIQQVLVNLLNNASQAVAVSGRPGEVKVRARPWMGGVAIDVIDDGPGMPDSVARRVFDPFFTTKPEGEGTGLGLTICQQIVAEHGGRIALHTRPGHGATFTVELPAAPDRVEPPPASPPDPGASDGLAILLVDDEPHIIHYLRTTLEAWGHRVASAPDGAAGLELARAGPFDVVICDLRMPRVGGREFYRELASKNPAMAARVIFSTGDTVRGDTLAFLEGIGRPWLNKPFSLAELRAALRQAAPGPGADG